MTPSARLGDKHVCPLPGHATTPIASASVDVNINFMGSARVGDTCGCGAVITTGFPSIQVNGRPMAHLGSPTSHGGTIITGSGNVGGGFVMGDAGGAPIINFMALGAFRADGTVDDEKMATLLADPKLKEKAVAANALVTPQAASKKPDIKPEPQPPKTCKDPDMMERVAGYIAGEMNRNIKHPSILKMKQLNSFDAAAENAKFQKLPWYARLSPPNFQAMQLGNTVTAMALWTERVGQNRPWDHKVTIGQQFGGAWQKHGQLDYFYDIWSNIHYGYVGRAGGLTESALLDGAGLEQIASDSIRKIQKWDERKGPHRSADIEGLRAWDDIGDRVSISIGIKLYKQHPTGGVTAKMLMDEVLALPRSSWGDGTRDHVCK
ncbi:polymorphic toxin type 44 domain-containing protein [Pseudomonas sp. CP4]|uniref:polymorphic toxin type 44 domain-containing protein n=1 Tax=Pseudomonas sp. CP4 TaxID=3388844 RepID=UPI0039EF6D17